MTAPSAHAGGSGATHAGTAPHRRLPESLSRRYLLGFDTDTLTTLRSDVLVIGSGIAGLTAALGAAASGRTVHIVTKARISETNTWYAQGGVAGAVGEADSVDLHLADTLVVGAGLCDEDVVQAVVGEAALALRDLEALGVDFDREASGRIDLHREGGHSLPRVLHSGDATGAEIQNTVSAIVKRAERVRLFEERFLVDLLTEDGRCVGALIHDPDTRELEVFLADAVVLATGGAGQLFRVTTNPAIATGDGVAAAWRAGAELADLEFVQFHPTAFDSTANPKALITEALRGEGAYLLDCDEQRFMLDVHPLAELAPRDVVSREIVKVMDRCGRPNVWLDARHLGEAVLRAKFPTIFENCLEAGYDLSRDLVPVAPAAHYSIGGIRVDIDGRTSVAGLYASGECACSGLHGANRLASNSLLEGLVLSRRIVRALAGERPGAPGRITADAPTAPRPAEVLSARAAIQAAMSDAVGVMRSEEGLARAGDRLEELSARLDARLRTPFELEVRNMATLATLTAHAARYRTESRGAHWRDDFPARDDENWRVHTVWQLGASPRLEPVRGRSVSRSAS
ncbi:MAG: L-aspartate oxidase [Coriobacteriia bacterium]|nr:L-aspartate oxidase [Coriobacteriia bacterium]